MADPPAELTKLSAADVLAITEGVEESFRSLLEKGLFDDCDSAAKDVIQSLTEAFTALESGDAVTGNRHMLQADHVIHQVLYNRTWWWRFHNRFQPLIVLYNLLILAQLFYAGGWEHDPATTPKWLLLPVEIWGIPIEVLAFGAVGAILRVLYWMHRKVAAGEFRPRIQLGYFLAPWIGALFGALVYAIVKAGLWTFQGEAAEDAGLKLWAVLALAALAGFSWEWITEWMANVMSKIAQRGGVPPKEPAADAGGGGAAGEAGAAPGKKKMEAEPEAEPEPPALDELPDQPEGA